MHDIPNKHEETEILNPRLHQIFNTSLTPIVEPTEGKEADEKMMEDGESKVGVFMFIGYKRAQCQQNYIFSLKNMLHK